MTTVFYVVRAFFSVLERSIRCSIDSDTVFLVLCTSAGRYFIADNYRHQNRAVSIPPIILLTCSLRLKLSDRYIEDLSKQIACSLVELIDSTTFVLLL